MEDKRSIKKVLESQGDMHEKVANQSNSELLSSSPTRCSGPPRIQIDVQIAYDIGFGRSTYAWKGKEITFTMALVSCPTKIGVVRNHQKSTVCNHQLKSLEQCRFTLQSPHALLVTFMTTGCHLQHK
jgi:hypothetical protein